MKKRQIVGLLLAMTMLGGTMSVYAEAQDDVRISDEVITYTVAGAYNAAGNGEWNDTIQFQEYESRLGIKLDAKVYDQEQWTTKLPLMIAADELPDLLLNAKIGQSDLVEWGDDGYLLDFSQYLDLMPNLQHILEEYPEYKAAITTDTGAIYGFSALNTWNAATLTTNVWLQESWLENLGLEKPTTLDEFYNVLKAFKEQDANGNGDPDDEIPMGMGVNMYEAMYPVLWAYGIYAKEDTYHRQVDENGNVVLMDTTENYKEFLKFMNQLYTEGLINQDAFVITFAEMKQKASEGLVGINGHWAGITNADEWCLATGFTTEEYNPEQVAVIGSRVGTEYKIAANADVENPEELAKFIDYLFTNEGALSSVNGYEGISFDYLDVAGYGVADHSNYWEGYDSAEAYRAQKAIAADALNVYATNTGTIYDLLANTATEDLMSEEVYSACGLNAVREVAVRTEGLNVMTVYSGVTFTDEELEERGTLYTDINTYLASMFAQFVTGEVDIDEGWDNYLAELDKMGLERLMEIEQAAYDRYIAK